MKTKFIKIFSALVAVMLLHACSLETVQDPNFLSVGSVATNASKIQLNSLAYGSISSARNGLAIYLQVTGTIGKELFNFNTTESRWMTELNGLRLIDNSAFYNGATTSFGLPVRQANVLLASVEKTSLVTDTEKNGYRGLANTFKGLSYLYMLNAQYQNGIRLNVEDPFKPSKPASYTESLAGIAGFLDQAYTQLNGAGSSFPFDMPVGFASFNTPPEFKKFNRAIALRVAIYQKDFAKAATILPLTFVSETSGLNVGPQHTFNPSSPDIGNPLLNTTSATIVALQNIFDAIEKDDARLAKVSVGSFTYTSGTNYSTTYKSALYTTATQPVSIIRNEELILIAAEIAAQQNNLVEATRLINVIRNKNGLPSLGAASPSLPFPPTPSVPASKDEAINAILKERLYSLWYEGHRWVDMRRYDKISQIFLPVSGMKVLTQLERPVQEVNWDAANP